jgi:magnesium transporter
MCFIVGNHEKRSASPQEEIKGGLALSSVTAIARTMESPQAPDEALAMEELLQKCAGLGPREAAELLEQYPAGVVSKVLRNMIHPVVRPILGQFPTGFRTAVLEGTPEPIARQWEVDENYADGTVGSLMEDPVAVFRPEQTVEQVIDRLRDVVKRSFVTYGFVVDHEHHLVGIFTMRDLLFSSRQSRLQDVMLQAVFHLQAEQDLVEAMKATVSKHYPVYPVTDSEGKLVGALRGQTLFEAQAFELSAQAGRMVGVEKEERLSTPWKRSLFFRHPWLQLNLVTAFLAAAVVGVFESTIDQVVALAVFLPVLAGQSGNTGCQALAVCLRAMTLGELGPGKEFRAVAKEALLGLVNGVLVGFTAGLGMLAFASWQQNPKALILAIVVFLAMVGSCLTSGIFGAIVPMVLKRCGADPATASSIFLTTATDVVSMGLFLWLATILVL